MPVLDGFELLREVRESPRWRDLPMIVVSTLGAEADRRQAARLGADGYLLKSDLQRAPLVDTVSRFVTRTRGSA
jgi:two-component system chemotaxis sensor kinase CheA